MTVSPPAPRRWLARAGLVAAAAGVSVGAVGCTGGPSPDAPSPVRSVVLPAPAAVASALPTSAPPAALPEPTLVPGGRNPFVPLDAPAPSPVPETETGVLTRVLGPGSRGDEVQLVQRALVGHGAPLTVDGVYGVRTTAAVTDFQRASGLAADGVVGALTWEVLRRPAAG